MRLILTSLTPTAMSNPFQQDRQSESFDNRYEYGPSPQLHASLEQPANAYPATQLEVTASPQASPEGLESPQPNRVNLTPSILVNVDEHKVSSPVAAAEGGATPNGVPVALSPMSDAQKGAMASLSAAKSQDGNSMSEIPDDKLIELIESELFSKASAKTHTTAAPVKDSIAQGDTPKQAALKADMDFWQSAMDDGCKVRPLGSACLVFVVKARDMCYGISCSCESKCAIYHYVTILINTSFCKELLMLFS